MRATLLFTALVGLTGPGCTGANGDVSTAAGVDGGSDSATLPTAIESVTPSWDSTLGGVEVTLMGTFGADVSVRFGGTDAELKSVQPDAGRLVLYAPATQTAGTVSVVIESNGTTATLPEAFTYYQDGTGKVGLFGTVTWLEQVGSYWGTEPASSGYAYVVPVEPTEFAWPLVYAPTADTCVSTTAYTYSPNPVTLDVGAGSVATMEVGGTPIVLPWNTERRELGADGLTDAELVPGSDVDLTTLTLTNPIFPDYTLPNLSQLPAAFTVTSPALGGASLDHVGPAFTLSWEGGEPADGVFVTLKLYDGAGTGYQEAVTCALVDDGTFDVPATVWTTEWPINHQLDLFVTRYRTSTATLPFNNADTAVLGEYQVYGATLTK